ncbi:MAG: shikimate dehydrogenase [Candidatus Omnitrophica bacterium]|nr:shikimate dehydrogenase [Candidatus Omnitrophota bacterium]
MKKVCVYGLIGEPIHHSLSPLMHNAALSALKLKASYKLFPLKEKDLWVFLSNIKKKNIHGLNITIPYKEKILKYISGYKTEAVNAIGAANTLVIDKKDKVKFFNTDYLGFIQHLKELKIKPKRVALIGAGGAAKALCFAFGKMKTEFVAIYDVDNFRSLSLMQRFNQIFPEMQFMAAGSISELNLEDKDLLINASPVGMKPDDPLLLNSALLHKDLFVYDLIYNPSETKLLKLARENGLACSNGLGMLLYQGVEALSLWISPKKVPIDLMRKVLEKASLKAAKVRKRRRL